MNKIKSTGMRTLSQEDLSAVSGGLGIVASIASGIIIRVVAGVALLGAKECIASYQNAYSVPACPENLDDQMNVLL